jgi:predicted flavoprotein YhiN
LKDFRLTVKKVRPLKEAQVTAGGVDTDEVSPNLESKIKPTLFFAGEILDIDGDSGGFNLQWAWSSGKVAGESAAKVAK